MAINVTERAAKQLKQINERERRDLVAPYRMGVKGGGCSGYEYSLHFEDKKQDFDKDFEFEGLHFYVDEKSYFFLNGITLDFDDSNPLQASFIWKNPNATGTCGCGTSFSV
ncbi:MAG: iron-sulfur cluster assembly accessory protein [Planctomycetes bacterium]|nr:iron-sulfur cluster assembly accessory protein [Planctomycetota bacterium]